MHEWIKMFEIRRGRGEKTNRLEMCRSEKLFLLREKFIDSLQFVYPMQFPNISLFKFLTRLTMLEDKTASHLPALMACLDFHL